MEVFTRYFKDVLLILWMVALGGCASVERGGTGQATFDRAQQVADAEPVSQAELQDDLLRFETQFNARIQDASLKLEASPDMNVRFRAILNRMTYYSNALNIALGPNPESNLLDMITFITLSRDVYEKHWVPKVFGSQGEALARAFRESEKQLWLVADKVLSPEQKRVLEKTISDWRAKHPDQLDVETVRLSGFSSVAGAQAAGLSEDVGGLFASVQQSTQSVDDARLFAERALYYAERAPLMFRLQARLGVHEILREARLALGQYDGPFAHAQEVQELLKELQKTLLAAQMTSQDVNSTLRSLGELLAEQIKHPEHVVRTQETLSHLVNVLKEWNRFLGTAQSQSSVSQMAKVAAQVGKEGNRFLTLLFLTGAGLIALFWGMALASRLAYRYLSVKYFRDARRGTEGDRRDKAA